MHTPDIAFCTLIPPLSKTTSLKTAKEESMGTPQQVLPPIIIMMMMRAASVVLPLCNILLTVTWHPVIVLRPQYQRHAQSC